MVSTIGVDTLSTGVTGVPPLDCLIVAFVNVDALSALNSIVKSAAVPRLAPAIIPTRHVEARGRLVTSVKITCALVEVQFTAVADVAPPTRTSSRCDALASVLTRLITHGYKLFTNICYTLHNVQFTQTYIIIIKLNHKQI